jgi:hypothetical protein
LINRKNLHLAISAIILTIVSLTYGLSPNNILPKLFDFKVESIDLKHTFRATMGLYLGMAILCLFGISKTRQWRTATISNIFFMIGLAVGRIISLVVDGIPSIYFSVGIVLELTLAIWGIINLNKYQSTIN